MYISHGLPRLCVTIRKEHRRVVVSNFRRCKIKDKKEVHETMTCTSVCFFVSSVGFSVDITLSYCSQQRFYTPPSVATLAVSRPAAPIY